MTKKNAIKKMDLSALVEKLPGSVYCKDMNGVYLGCNEYMARMAGVASSAEVIGKTDYDMPWREQADAFRIIDQAVIASGEPKTLEETGKLANGVWATYLTTKEPMRDKDGKIIGLYGLSVEITKYKQFENKLLKEKQAGKKQTHNIFSNLDQIISCMPGSVYWKDREGAYLGCNNALLAAAGFSSMDEIIGKTDYDLAKLLGASPRVAEEFRRVDSEVIRSGMPQLNHEEPPFHFGGGKIVNQLTNKVPLRDESGHVIGVLGISIDITERNKKEAAFLEQVFACMPGIVFWKDKNGAYRNCNDALASLIGLSKSEVIGKTDYDLAKKLGWSKDSVESFERLDQEVIRSGIPRLNIEELPFRAADEKLRVHLTNKMPLRDVDGSVIGVVGMSIDITDRKKMEEELRAALKKLEVASQSKTEFINNMSHDVKTPLSGIISISEALCSRVQEENRDLTQDVLQAGQHLMVFFENCIELSKLESGSIVLSKETFSLRHLLNEILNLFRPVMKAKGLALHVDCDETIPKRLLGSRVTLYRILLNLVGNAVKFTPEGSVTIRTELSQNSTPEKAIVKLTIADTGIGIPADKQKLIFERFARLTPSYQGTYEGSGIGLYIVDEFVKSMGGEIHVKSEEGKGSLFIVAVPLQVPLLADNEYDDLLESPSSLPPKNGAQSKVLANEPAGSSVQATESMPSETAASRIKVLVVEDSLMAQKGVSLLLSSLGCKVDVASCGKEAVTLFKPGYYALVLMDIGLPDMKGYEIARRLKKLEKGTSFSVPILGLSAHATEDEKQLSESVGMAEMLSKPLLLEQAKAVLMRYGGRKPASVNKNLFLMENGLRIIDLQKAPGNSSGDEKTAWEILDELINALPESRLEIEEAYEAHDTALLIATVHKFRGGLCYTKAPHLLQAVNILEEKLREGKHDELDVLYTKVLKAMETLEKVYQSL